MKAQDALHAGRRAVRTAQRVAVPVAVSLAWCLAALSVVALLGGCTTPRAPAVARPVIGAEALFGPPAGYRLVWADEFDKPGLPDATRWLHDTVRNREGWYNHEQQYYAAPRLENARVQDGRLVITARREALSGAPDWGGQAYTSARLITRGLAQWTYGFFEVRARMPCGKGTWPAIWTLGSGGRWPADGELDIVEHQGHHAQRVSSAVHTAAGSGGEAVSGKTRLPTACSAFHDYQMLWTPQAVSFGVDGRVHWTYHRDRAEPGGWPFDQAQFMILNLAIGGDLGGVVDDAIFPVSFEVDHVRVYQAPAAGGAP